MEAVQGHVNLGYTSVAKAGHVRGINLQVKGGGRDANRTDEGSMPIRESEENYFYRCSNVRGIFGGN